MLNISSNVLDALSSPRRQIGARALLARGSSYNHIKHTDNLKKFSVDIVGENGKFFGYGVSQKATVEILDKNRKYVVDGQATVELAYEIEGRLYTTYPVFHIEPTETKRDEKTNTLTLVGYDALFTASAHTFSEVDITAPYTLGEIANACAMVLGLRGAMYDGVSTNYHQLVYNDGGNLEGTETLREIFDDIAEATQTIYYVDSEDVLIFKHC